MSPQVHRSGGSASLPATECLALVRSHTIGRVGWNAPDGPQILPVTYVLRDESIIFRTAPYGALSELRNAHQVAFEVDEFDVVTRTGWTVLVRGMIQAAANPDELTGLWDAARTRSPGRPVLATWSSSSRPTT